MNNPASFLILLFLAITFLQSGYDMVPLALAKILILELISGILAIAGMVQLLYNGEREYGFYAGVMSCITLIFLLFGQRLAKDYDGARTIVIYFVPAVLVVYWLN